MIIWYLFLILWNISFVLWIINVIKINREIKKPLLKYNKKRADKLLKLVWCFLICMMVFSISLTITTIINFK